MGALVYNQIFFLTQIYKKKNINRIEVETKFEKGNDNLQTLKIFSCLFH